MTVGIESGYARGPADVADIMRAVPAAGAIGVSIEDAQYPGEPLRAIGEQAERIAAAREAADAEGVPMFVSPGSLLHRAAPRREGSGPLPTSPWLPTGSSSPGPSTRGPSNSSSTAWTDR